MHGAQSPIILFIYFIYNLLQIKTKTKKIGRIIRTRINFRIRLFRTCIQYTLWFQFIFKYLFSELINKQSFLFNFLLHKTTKQLNVFQDVQKSLHSLKIIIVK